MINGKWNEIDRTLDDVATKVVQLAAEADRVTDTIRSQTIRFHDALRNITQQLADARAEIHRAGGQNYDQPAFAGLGSGKVIDEHLVAQVARQVMQTMQSPQFQQGDRPRG